MMPPTRGHADHLPSPGPGLGDGPRDRGGGIIFVRDLLRPDDDKSVRLLVRDFTPKAPIRINGKCSRIPCMRP